MKLDGWRFALQIVNFLVLVWLLQHFLYRPARRALDRRKEAWAREQQSLAERQARLGALEAESKAQREESWPSGSRCSRRHKWRCRRSDTGCWKRSGRTRSGFVPSPGQRWSANGSRQEIG